MSLHDMYFSKKNKNHMFSVIQDLVLNETGTDINHIMDYVDLYRGVPNSTRYRPNKLMTFEKDRQEWLLQRMKRHFKDFDNGKITEQQYKTELRTLIGNG